MIRRSLKNRERLNQLNRKAVIALFLYAGFIVGFCFLLLRVTAWRQSEPGAEVPFYTTIPGVNVENLPPAKVNTVLKKLNIRRCHCGCMRSVAGCRNHHSSCTESTIAAQDEVNAARRR